MTSESQEDVSLVLVAIKEGQRGAEERLFRLVYDELRRMAQKRVSDEARGPSLQATALVHEAYLRLFGKQVTEWENRRHFFGAAARAMRQILVDRARERLAKKRDHGGKRITFDDNVPDAERPVELIALDEALARFAREHPRKADVVKFRYFLGLTVEETAKLLEVAPRTVDTDWQFAKAWLRREMDRGDRPGA